MAVRRKTWKINPAGNLELLEEEDKLTTSNASVSGVQTGGPDRDEASTFATSISGTGDISAMAGGPLPQEPAVQPPPVTTGKARVTEEVNKKETFVRDVGSSALLSLEEGTREQIIDQVMARFKTGAFDDEFGNLNITALNKEFKDYITALGAPRPPGGPDVTGTGEGLVKADPQPSIFGDTDFEVPDLSKWLIGDTGAVGGFKFAPPEGAEVPDTPVLEDIIGEDWRSTALKDVITNAPPVPPTDIDDLEGIKGWEDWLGTVFGVPVGNEKIQFGGMDMPLTTGMPGGNELSDLINGLVYDIMPEGDISGITKDSVTSSISRFLAQYRDAQGNLDPSGLVPNDVQYFAMGSMVFPQGGYAKLNPNWDGENPFEQWIPAPGVETTMELFNTMVAAEIAIGAAKTEDAARIALTNLEASLRLSSGYLLAMQQEDITEQRDYRNALVDARLRLGDQNFAWVMAQSSEYFDLRLAQADRDTKIELAAFNAALQTNLANQANQTTIWQTRMQMAEGAEGRGLQAAIAMGGWEQAAGLQASGQTHDYNMKVLQDTLDTRRLNIELGFERTSVEMQTGIRWNDFATAEAARLERQSLERDRIELDRLGQIISLLTVLGTHPELKKMFASSPELVALGQSYGLDLAGMFGDTAMTDQMQLPSAQEFTAMSPAEQEALVSELAAQFGQPVEVIRATIRRNAPGGGGQRLGRAT